MKIKKNISNIVKKIQKASLMMPMFVFFAMPASSNYQLKGYEFGGGGGVGESTNYSMEGVVGQLDGKQSSTNYGVNSGLMFVQMANTPGAPTFENNGDWYSKLFFIIDTSGNPSDATYAIAISDDNWVTTRYVQSDNTVGNTLGIEDFQTYAAWGGGSGGYIIGLADDTTYKIKVKARQGVYTEGPFGPEATAATSAVSLTFDIDISSIDIETAGPYSVDIGSLTAGNVSTASEKIWIDVDTNAYNGAQVFVSGQNSGLTSATTSYTITSATANLSVASEGYGLRGSSTTQTSGGPIALQSPYNGANENVGVVNNTMRSIISSSNAVVGGRTSIFVKAKPSNITKAASDYTDLLTIVAAGNF